TPISLFPYLVLSTQSLRFSSFPLTKNICSKYSISSFYKQEHVFAFILIYFIILICGEMMDYQQYPRNDLLCIDMRSFYASIEAVKLGLDPMKTMLAVVGDLSRSGSIVLAASPALKKKYGINNVSRYFELPHDPMIHIVQANMADYL